MNGIYVTVELEGDLATRIHDLQRRWDPRLARELPPHISVLGSSGVGPIPPDTPVPGLRAAIEAVSGRATPMTLAFGPPMRFIGREIVVLPLDPHGPLRELHEALSASLRAAGIRPGVARWPFTPHCTLHFYPTLTTAALHALLAIRESEPWRLHTLRVYHTRDNVTPKLLFDAPLSGPAPIR